VFLRPQHHKDHQPIQEPVADLQDSSARILQLRPALTVAVARGPHGFRLSMVHGSQQAAQVPHRQPLQRRLILHRLASFRATLVGPLPVLGDLLEVQPAVFQTTLQEQVQATLSTAARQGLALSQVSEWEHLELSLKHVRSRTRPRSLGSLKVI